MISLSYKRTISSLTRTGQTRVTFPDPKSGNETFSDFGSRVFSPMAPSQAQSGRRARERLTITLFGAKDGGHHHRKPTSTLTSFLSYETTLHLNNEIETVQSSNQEMTVQFIRRNSSYEGTKV